MLNQFRQTSQFLGRTLLGMMLFVWLSLALAPCVMAYDLQFLDSKAESSELHVKMANCIHCPADHDSMSNALDNQVICQNTFNNFSDSMAFAFDSVDVESFVLFEIPTAVSTVQRWTKNSPPSFKNLSDFYALSPLALTGILRI